MKTIDEMTDMEIGEYLYRNRIVAPDTTASAEVGKSSANSPAQPIPAPVDLLAIQDAHDRAWSAYETAKVYKDGELAKYLAAEGFRLTSSALLPDGASREGAPALPEGKRPSPVPVTLDVLRFHGNERWYLHLSGVAYSGVAERRTVVVVGQVS